MTAAQKTTLWIATLALAALAALAAAKAPANVVNVYTSSFNKQADVRQLKAAGGGKRCQRRWQRQSNRLRMIATRGPAECGVRPPVEGIAAQPDHTLRVDGRIGQSGPAAVRRASFLLARVRAGGGRYQLKVQPHGRRYELSRRPASPDFPVEGTNGAIDPRGLNRVRLAIAGDTVRASVNGELLEIVTDSDPEEVTGTRLHFGFGHDRQTNQDVFAAFDRIVVSVPRP